jgi:hypothetical protein
MSALEKELVKLRLQTHVEWHGMVWHGMATMMVDHMDHMITLIAWIAFG